MPDFPFSPPPPPRFQLNLRAWLIIAVTLGVVIALAALVVSVV